MACIIFIPFLSQAQNNVLLYGGNAFYWSDARTDTTKEIDAETGEILWKIVSKEAAFTKMNKETIYSSSDKETTEPVFKYNNLDEVKYFQTLFKSKPEFKGIPPFSIDKMVINKAGKPIYFELHFDDVANAKTLREKWGSLVEKYVKNMPNWQPGLYQRQPVIYYLGEYIHIGA